MSETSKVLAKIGPESSPLVITLDEFKGRRIVDVRRYFTDKETKELVPTKKGLSLTTGTFNSLEEFAYQFGKDVKAWLGGAANSNAQNLINRSNAVDNNSANYQDFEIKFDAWRGHNFFSIASEGNKNIVTFNTLHPFIERLQNKKDTEEALRCIASVIVTFKRACYRFDDIDSNYDILFHSLENEWGNLLRNYATESR